MTMPIKAALLGCGALAEILAARVYPRVTDSVNVVAAVDVSLERARAVGDGLGAPAFSALADAAAAVELDAVDVRLPHHLHLEGARLAAARGLPFLIEKPMASSLEDARAIAELAERTGRGCGVSENYGHLEPVRAARDLFTAGAIGELLVAQATRVFELGAQWRRDGWRVTGGGPTGVVIDQATHVSRLLRTVIGEVVEVHAYASGHRGDFSAEDSAVVTCRMRSGRIATQLLTWACPTPAAPDRTPELTLYGSEGSISVYISYEGEGGGALLQRPRMKDEWHGTGTNYYDSLADVLRAWAKAVGDGAEPSCSISEGLADVAVMEAIRQSIHTGATVQVAETSR
jgi:predicted dehydrogenase